MNIFFDLTGIFGSLLMLLSAARDATYAFDGPEWTWTQYCLTGGCFYMTFLGCLAEVTL